MEHLGIQATVLTPASGETYTDALKRLSDLSSLPAGYIIQPETYADIPPVLAHAASQSPPLEIAVKCGGAHSSTWASTAGGIVIDLGKLKAVTLAEDKKSITVQGGALWGDVYEVTAKEEVDVVGSPLWFVGVGGFTLGGGYGPLSGEYGLTIDNMLAATVVLADGRIVKTSREEEPDLFWAIRGGGGQFGIVVEFVFKVLPSVGPISAGFMAFPGSAVESLAKTLSVSCALQEWQSTQSGAERLMVQFSRAPPHFKPGVVVIPQVFHDTDGSRATTVLEPLMNGTRVAPVVAKVGPTPDMNTLSHAADAGMAKAPKRLVIRGAFLSRLDPTLFVETFKRWAEFTETEDVRASGVIFDITSPAALVKVPKNDAALGVRTPHYWAAVQGRSTTDESVPAARKFADELSEFMRERNAELSGEKLPWMYSMCHGSERPEDVWGDHLERLRRLKAKYDPKKVFSKGVVIEPIFD
ncbi:FAD-binding domain-containing protein [Epithele typhae]|uniref:FAD-binding domain-containing protein n=1 Tax=Epithele typhae TaxID=378194 RepID=UPI0020076C8B|nr:FAD-binding domain-containing protein [Epithele typhae]KAH9930455.1 FAD-binding domain-containing protein [Epithele typhae]